MNPLNAADLATDHASDLATDLASYRRDGYLIARDALPAAFLDDMERAIFEPIALQARHVLGRDFSVRDPLPERQRIMAELKQAAPERYLSALKVAQLDPRILASAAQPALLATLRGLGLRSPVVSLKPYPIVIAPNLFFENGYNIRPAHQEWPVMQGSRNGLVIWFPLHDIASEHSSLEMYPGSHLRGVLPYEVSRCGSRTRDDALDIEPVRLELRRGDFVAFSCFTVHRSSPDGDSLRAAISIRYSDLQEPSFIERAFPDTVTYRITREPLDDQPHAFLG